MNALVPGASINILIGDVRERLRGLPSEYFDCVLTSPPYWGLRDYDIAGQIGLEPTLGEHLAVMVDVFREVRRVLKRHGTLWLNYGDCYATTPNGRAAADVVGDDRTFRDKPFSTIGPIYDPNHGAARGKFSSGDRQTRIDSGGRIVAGGMLKPKDLCMIPNRLAIALQDDGWYVRSEIIWHKPNPMPESVYDRPTSAHEKVWLLTKSEEYFYNHASIREPVTGGAHARGSGLTPKSAAEGTNIKAKGSFHASVTQLVESRNARNVWKIASRAYREAHFATFPPALAERCIKAGVPATVCGCCGAVSGCGPICEAFPRVPGRVLDPFGGAGTVGMVAKQLGVDATLIDLKPEYAAMAERRIAATPFPIPLPASGDVPAAGEPSPASASAAVSPGNLAPADPATEEGACGHAPPATIQSSCGRRDEAHPVAPSAMGPRCSERRGDAALGQQPRAGVASGPQDSNSSATAIEMDRDEDASTVAMGAHLLSSGKRPEGEPQGAGAVSHAGTGESPVASGPEQVPFGLDAGAIDPGREPVDIPAFLPSTAGITRAPPDTVIGKHRETSGAETDAGPMHPGPASSFEDFPEIPEFLRRTRAVS